MRAVLRVRKWCFHMFTYDWSHHVRAEMLSDIVDMGEV